MAEVVLFHHVQGLTDGLIAFADRLRADGHLVHTPDLFAGTRPASIDAGLAYVRDVGDDELARRAAATVDDLPAAVVYAGVSLGAAYAQRLAQTRPGAAGALLYEAFVSLTAPWSFGPWPPDVPVQIHGMRDDPFFAGEGDLAGARELVATVGPARATVYEYPGDRHLFIDSSLPSYDPDAAALVVARTLAFLRALPH